MKPWQKGYVSVEDRRSVPVLKVEKMTPAELQEVADAIRHEAVNEARDDAGELRWPTARELDEAMTMEAAIAELKAAQRTRRLVVKWHRGWLYVYYSPYPAHEGMHMRHCICRIPRSTVEKTARELERARKP